MVICSWDKRGPRRNGEINVRDANKRVVGAGPRNPLKGGQTPKCNDLSQSIQGWAPLLLHWHEIFPAVKLTLGQVI
jgi:hypothetical protein